ncbi:MAG: DNA/RNA nuclease SfsA [Chloroflexi bacterium]|nr:DNA/RNA nuclease SfsA [Chloroflexota bacterium]
MRPMSLGTKTPNHLPTLKLEDNLKEATFVKRLNRFLVLVDIGSQQEKAHLPNSGRLGEILTPERPIWLVTKEKDHRRTGYDFILAALGNTLVSVDARIPSKLVFQALIQDALIPFHGYPTVTREVMMGNSRLDLMVANAENQCFIEAKSITLVQDGLALFPDAPTSRGTRHLRSLIQAKELGHRAAVLFIIQREDAIAFAPNDRADPEFGRTLRQAIEKGIEAYACRCRVSLIQIQLDKMVDICL